MALLSAIGRLLEGIVAERMDRYAEERGIAHSQIHGFRRGRGVGTGMLSPWEDILEEAGDGKKVVALAFNGNKRQAARLRKEEYRTKGAESQDKEGKGDIEGEKKEGAGGHPTKER